MPRIPFVLVDVFAERPLEGNQLCVLLDAPDLDPALVQALAAEIGFSETTWVLETSPAHYRMRIFTPGTEMPFAGHPSLGTAYVLAALGHVGAEVTQVVAAGEYPITVDLDAGSARMRQGRAEFGPSFEDREALAGALGISPGALHDGLPATPVSTGLHHLITPVVSEETVRSLRPDPRAIREIADATAVAGIYAAAVTGRDTAVARFFGPGVGVGEDAATGSAAGPLGAYLFRHGRIDSRLAVAQGRELGRPSRLHVELDGPREDPVVWVSGGVRIVGQGAFDVPDP